MAECKGKRRYATLGDAQRALTEGQRTWRYPPVRWYACPVCDGYHLSGKRKAAPGDLDAQSEAFTEARDRRVRANRSRNPFADLKLEPDDA